MNDNVKDKVGKEYWSNVWWEEKGDISSSIDWRDSSLSNYKNYKLDDYFVDVFGGIDTSNMSLLEVGCAGSDKLPYFKERFGFDIYGLDYSEKGCELSREILKKEGVEGRIECADMFDPPNEFKDNFDVVISFGVIEHFESTSRALNAIASMTKEGGIVISIIPNMQWLTGFLQWLVDEDVYKMHKPLSSRNLYESHDVGKFEVLRCEYFMSMNLNIVNTDRYRDSFKREVIDRFKSYITKSFWYLGLDKVVSPNRFTSSNIISVARVK